MDFAQIVRGRRTVHNYKPERVSDDLVLEALRLSLWAPNHRLTFPWAYFLVGEQARVRLADLAAELKGKPAVRETVLNPSHFVLLARLKSGDSGAQHEDFATLACSVLIASLFLWERGIGSKWTTSGFTSHARTYEILGISPAEYELEGGLMIGVPSVVPKASERPELNSVLRRVR